MKGYNGNCHAAAIEFIKENTEQVILFVEEKMNKQERLEFVKKVKSKVPYSAKTETGTIRCSFKTKLEKIRLQEMLQSL